LNKLRNYQTKNTLKALTPKRMRVRSYLRKSIEMKHEIILCNHRAKKGTLQAKKYGTLIIFLIWTMIPAIIYSMTLEL